MAATLAASLTFMLAFTAFGHYSHWCGHSGYGSEFDGYWNWRVYYVSHKWVGSYHIHVADHYRYEQYAPGWWVYILRENDAEHFC